MPARYPIEGVALDSLASGAGAIAVGDDGDPSAENPLDVEGGSNAPGGQGGEYR